MIRKIGLIEVNFIGDLEIIFAFAFVDIVHNFLRKKYVINY